MSFLLRGAVDILSGHPDLCLVLAPPAPPLAFSGLLSTSILSDNSAAGLMYRSRSAGRICNGRFEARTVNRGIKNENCVISSPSSSLGLYGIENRALGN